MPWYQCVSTFEGLICEFAITSSPIIAIGASFSRSESLEVCSRPLQKLNYSTLVLVMMSKIAGWKVKPLYVHVQSMYVYRRLLSIYGVLFRRDMSFTWSPFTPSQDIFFHYVGWNDYQLWNEIFIFIPGLFLYFIFVCLFRLLVPVYFSSTSFAIV